jgi:hypothetical protein
MTIAFHNKTMREQATERAAIWSFVWQSVSQRRTFRVRYFANAAGMLEPRDQPSIATAPIVTTPDTLRRRGRNETPR